MRLIVLSKQNKHSNDLHEIVLSKNLFHQLFLMIFYAQASNRKFIDETLTIMADSFLNFLSRLSQDKKLKHKKGASQRVNVEKNNKEPLGNPSTEENRLVDEDSDNEADYNIYLAEPIEEMLGNLEARYNIMSNSNNGFLTDEIKWLISFLKKNLTLEIFQRIIPEDENGENRKITYDEYEYFKKSDNTVKILLKFVFDPIIKEFKNFTKKEDLSRLGGEEK